MLRISASEVQKEYPGLIRTEILGSVHEAVIANPESYFAKLSHYNFALVRAYAQNTLRQLCEAQLATVCVSLLQQSSVLSCTYLISHRKPFENRRCCFTQKYKNSRIG